MPEFVPVIVVALLILAALYIVYGGGLAFRPTTQTGFISEEEVTATATPKEIGWIGYVPEVSLRHVLLGRDFSVSYMAGDETVASFSGPVSRGIAGGEDKKISFKAKLTEMKSAKISWTVNNSNYYGELMFVLNGIEVYRNISLVGPHEVKFNTTLLKEENNILEIKAASSGWRIWAPTAYIIDATVIVSYLGVKNQTFSFELTSDEVKGMAESRLVADVKSKEGEGSLIARVNGIEVYRDKPGTGSFVKDFSPALVGLKTSNTAELSSEVDTKYNMDDVEIIIYYRPAAYAVKSMWYNLTDYQYNSLSRNNATLIFYIDTIVGSPLGLLIRITDANGYTHRIVIGGQIREKNFYTATITSKDVASGPNRIEFVTSGEGGFLITNNTIS